MAVDTITSKSYITHHLQNLDYGKLPAGFDRDGQILEEATWTFAHSPEEVLEMGFWSFNVDSLGWSFFLGAIFPHDEMQVLGYNRLVKDLAGLTSESFISLIREKPKNRKEVLTYLSLIHI